MEFFQEASRRLASVIEEHRVQIPFACESGSRAWGFPSQNSDYDVRFLYIRPQSFYLSIALEQRRDVIEYPIVDDWDVNGWDLRKALQLFRKSNPPLMEWLSSPLVYREVGTLAARMRALMAQYYSTTACMYHYWKMAKGNAREYLRGDVVWLKKYLYALRPILAMRWLESGLGPAPTEFELLVEQTVRSPALLEAIHGLVEKKRLGHELDRGPMIPEISECIFSELARFEESGIAEYKVDSPVEPLDELFQVALEEYEPT